MGRVLLVFDPPDGGVAENVRLLALGLPEHGWQPFVVGPRESVIYDDLRAAGVPLARLPFRTGFSHPNADLTALRQLILIMRREHLDLVHSHNAKAGFLARLAARSVPAREIYSPQCFPFVAPYSRLHTWTSATIERFSGDVTDVLLCAAEDEREIAIDYDIVPPERLRVIHNACPQPETAVDLDLRSRGIPGGSPDGGHALRASRAEGRSRVRRRG